MEPIKIGIIGCGKQAPKHISGLRKKAGVEILLADIRPELAQALAQKEGLKSAASPAALFDDPSVVAVDICTPTGAHIPLIEQAIRSGKSFFCEKPLCEEFSVAERIERLMAEHGNPTGMVGYVYRFAPVFETAKQILDGVDTGKSSDALGRIVTASFRIGGRGSHQVWKHRRVTGGGAINEMLVHMLDLALWFFGPVSDIDVSACELMRPVRPIQGKDEEVDAEDYVAVKLTMANGVQVFVQADLLTPAFTQMVEIQGERGTFIGSIQPDMPSFIFCEKVSNGYPAGKTSLNFGQINLFEKQMGAFVDAIRNKSQPSRSTIKDSVILLRVLEDIKRRVVQK